MVMTAMFGLGLALSNVKSIFRPFLLYAVMEGIPNQKVHRNHLNQIVLFGINLSEKETKNSTDNKHIVL